MTRDEFNRWISHYFDCFPLTRDWVGNLPNPDATLTTWFKCLEPFPAVVCTTVTDRMSYGELEPIPAYDRDKTAIHVRAYAGRILDDSKRERNREYVARREDEERERYEARRSGNYPAGKLFMLAARIWEEGRAIGTPDDDIRARVSSELNEYLTEITEA